MSFLSDLSRGLGNVFGGPLGGIVGGAVGGALDEITGDVPGRYAPPAAPPAQAAPVQPDGPAPVVVQPKPVTASRTIWFNVVFSALMALLTWAAGYQWDGVFSPAVAVMVQGAANIVLRIATFAPVAGVR